MAGFPIIPGTQGALAKLTLASSTFTPTVSGLYLVRLCGGGGGGGAGGCSAALSVAAGGSGGGAGITTEAVMQLTAGTGYAVTIGAGGTAGTVTAGAGQVGGGGGTGGDSIFTGPTVLHAPGGGGGGGGNPAATITAATISGQVMTLTLSIANTFQQGEYFTVSGAAGGAWANLNGVEHLVISASGTTVIALACSATIPSGTYTASTGFLLAQAHDGGVPGGGGPTFKGLIFGPGYGGANDVFGASWVPATGTGPYGLAGGGGGTGGPATATNGGTGGNPGTQAAAGTNGTGGGSAGTSGTAGTAGAANSGAGGGGGGAGQGSSGNGASGGAGGTGSGLILGPF